MALHPYSPKPNCLFHSDQGIESAAHSYRDIIDQASMVRNMSRKGNPLDNTYVESFFPTMKDDCSTINCIKMISKPSLTSRVYGILYIECDCTPG